MTRQNGKTMRAWRVHRAGKPSEVLSLDEIAIPEPGPGEVRVKTRAAALNYNEVDGCHGRYLTVNPPIPYTLGMEVMGEVDAAGAGAELAIDYRAGDFVPAVPKATRGLGVDMVFDGVGGAVTEASVRALALYGRLMMIGFASGIAVEDQPMLTPRPIMFGSVTLMGVMLAYTADEQAENPAPGFHIQPRVIGDRVQRSLETLLADGAIRPFVGKVVGFADLPDALDEMDMRLTMGRTVVTIP
jgi:NADPH:quinone reductase-like Zn-dependent oxidoreductase